MTIGELARRTGCGIETIRYYEHEGLLPKPGRTSGNYRRYGPRRPPRIPPPARSPHPFDQAL